MKPGSIVLIVDDEYDILITLEMILSDLGYQVIMAYNGREALRQMGENKPELILLDHSMPILSGQETLKILKSNPEYDQIPIIYMSDLDQSEILDEHLWDQFLKRPFNIDDLTNVINRASPTV